MKVINQFSGDYFFLNGICNAPIRYNGLDYVCPESAFFAQKVLLPELRKEYCKLDGIDACKIDEQIEPRKDWANIENTVMYDVTWCKFTQNEEFAKKLLATEDAFLIDVNEYGDDKFGIYNKRGENIRGFILMNIRSRLKNISLNGKETIANLEGSEHYKLLKKWGIDFELSTSDYKQEIIDKFINYYGYEEILYMILPFLYEVNEMEDGDWEEEIEYITLMLQEVLI